MIFHPQKKSIKYQFVVDLLIELAILLIAFTIFYLNNWNFYLIAIFIFLLSSLINFLKIRWYVKNSNIIVTNKLIKVSKGRFFNRKAYIPNNKIYMLYKKNNYWMEKIGIATLEIRTLAKNYEVIGLSIDNVQSILDYFDEDIYG